MRLGRLAARVRSMGPMRPAGSAGAAGPMGPAEPRRKDGWPAALERLLASRRTALLLLCVFLLSGSAYVLNLTARVIDSGHVDEHHTLHMAFNHLNPLGKSNGNFRVGETSRWFARLLFPGGQYYMNGHRGGTIWEGGVRGYLREHYKAWRHKTVIRADTNIQDFVFFMRLAYGLMAVASFALASWALFVRFGIGAAAVYGSLVLASPLLWYQFAIFYTETTMFLVFNLAAFFCLGCNDMSKYRKVAYCAVLAAAALSTKLTGIVIAAALFAYVAFNMGGGGGSGGGGSDGNGGGGGARRKLDLRMELFVLCFGASMVLINVNAASVYDYFDDTLWNVFHYKVGHVTATDDWGGRAWRMMRDANRFVVPLFLAALAWLAARPRREFAAVYVLGGGVVLVVWSMVDASYYTSRNVPSVYVAMSFVIALGAGDLLGRVSRASSPFLSRLGAGASAGLALLFLGASLSLASGIRPAGEVFFREIRKPVQACAGTAAIGLTDGELRGLRRNARGPVDGFARIPGPVRVKPGGSGALASLKKFLEYDCLVVRRSGFAKHVTNHLALESHTLGSRVGNLFFFEKKDAGG